MDPQFRLQLESVYEALENAGIPLNKIAGSKTSVFAGAFFHDYNDSILRDADNIPRFYLTGLGSAMASNRISHFFDLRGPSMTVDTGCSTTLTALHQAVQSLRAGDADMSIVGGSNVMLNPDMFKTMSSLGLLSATVGHSLLMIARTGTDVVKAWRRLSSSRWLQRCETETRSGLSSARQD